MGDPFASVATQEDWPFLEEARVELSEEELTFLAAVVASDLAQVEALVGQGIGPSLFDADGRPVLLLAAQHGSAAMVRKLLELGVDPAVRSHEEGFEGSTVLMGLVCGFAPRDPDLEVLDVLLSAPGVDLEARDEEGWTALMHAVAAGPSRQEVVRRLIRAGADCEAENLDGESVRHLAEDRDVSLDP